MMLVVAVVATEQYRIEWHRKRKVKAHHIYINNNEVKKGHSSSE